MPPPKYHVNHSVLLSSNPANQIHVVKAHPLNAENNEEKTFYVLKEEPQFNGRHDAMSKGNALKSIIRALKVQTPTTDNCFIPSVHSPPIDFNPITTKPIIFPKQQHTTNHVVYNIQNRKTLTWQL